MEDPGGSWRKHRHGDPQGYLSDRHGPLRGGQEELGSIPGVWILLPFSWGNPPARETLHSLTRKQISLKPKARTWFAWGGNTTGNPPSHISSELEQSKSPPPSFKARFMHMSGTGQNTLLNATDSLGFIQETKDEQSPQNTATDQKGKKRSNLGQIGRERSRAVWFSRVPRQFIAEGGRHLAPEYRGAHRCTCPSCHPLWSQQHSGPELIFEHVERVTLL